MAIHDMWKLDKSSPLKNNKAKIAADIAAAKAKREAAGQAPGKGLTPERAAELKSQVDATKASMAAKKRAKFGGRFGEGNRETKADGSY